MLQCSGDMTVIIGRDYSWPDTQTYTDTCRQTHRNTEHSWMWTEQQVVWCWT